jgi:DNA polymerase-1
MASNHLYLVDGSGYIFRAYHRLPPLTNRHGIPAGAVYGFTTMMWKLVNELHDADGPTHLAVILDASARSFRNDMYDQYKAHRPPPPEDLVPQFPLIRDAVRAFSVPCIEQEGYEADDVIASYAVAAQQAGWQVTIVSSDKDLMQLVRPGIDMLDTMNDRRIGRAEVVEKFGVPPEQLGEVLALMGDSVDNVPGVPGIGPKTAAQLIQEHGTVEALLAATDSIAKPKLKQNLIDYAEDARMSRRLVELVYDLALPQPLEELTLKGMPPEPMRAFLEDQGFRSLLTKLGVTAAAAPSTLAPAVEEEVPFVHKDYETVVDDAALDRWIEEARAAGVVAVDTETDNVDSMRAELVGVSLATGPGKACYIPVGHRGDGLLSDPPPQLDRDLVLKKLRPLLEDEAVLKVGQNLKYDLVILRRNGVNVTPYDDTMLLSYALDAGKPGGHGMDELCQRHLGHMAIAFKDVCGTGRSQIGFDQVPLDRATEYAAEDADVTLRLWRRLKPRLTREAATRVYEMVDRPLVPVVAGMEMAGIKVDRAELARLSSAYAQEIARIEDEIYELAGGRFTIGSPKQLGDVLFERMGLAGGRKGKSGWSTDVNELERLAAGGAEIATKVLDWRQLTKLKSTYTDALQQQVNPHTDRVHTSFGLAVAQTGRLSSTDPNLQNIPIRTELGRRIRDAFVAERGHVILSADYSQIELRLAAHMADVPELKAAFAEGQDIHNLTAQELFGEVNRDTRGKAKTINFAILYGISAFGLAGRLGVDRGEAAAIIERYFQRFPGISRYIADTLEQVRDRGFVTTLFGRKTHLPGIKGKTQTERQAAERQAINAPIQGSSADLIKRAMTRMGPALLAAGVDRTRMLLQVHDELVFEVPDDEIGAASDVIRQVMEGAAAPAIELSVPLAVEIGQGASWGAAH